MDRYNDLMSKIKKLSTEYNIPVLFLIGSFLECRFIHGASWDNFCVHEMYKMNNRERKKVYTFKRQKKVSDFLNHNAGDGEMSTIMCKNKFNMTFKKYIKRNWYDATKPNRERFISFLQDNSEFLLKPILSSCGNGIEILKTSEIAIDKFYEEISMKDIILEEIIKQNAEIKSINPTSVNTVRLITAKFGNTVHILKGGALRCGGKNAFVDNFHSGGCAYPINVDTGIIDGPGLSLQSNQKIYEHPSTGKKMIGLQIPNWNTILETVSSAALIMPNIGYIGWDIAVLEDGCEIIEANVNYPDSDLVQLDGYSVYKELLFFLKSCGININRRM